MAVKDRATIINDINTIIVENGAWGISPADLSGILVDLADSYLQEEDTTKEFQAQSVDVSGVYGYKVDGIQVIAARQAHILDAQTAHALNPTFSDTEVESALNALGEKINTILDLLENHGLMDSLV